MHQGIGKDLLTFPDDLNNFNGPVIAIVMVEHEFAYE